MLRVMGREYPEQLKFKTGEIQIGKVRWSFFTIVVLSILTSFITLTIISFGYFAYAFPVFVAIQLIGSIINLYTFKNKFLQNKNVRLLGFNKDGEFLGSEFEKKIFLYVLELSYKLKLKKAPMVAIQESPEINAYAIGASKNKALIVINSETIRSLPEEAVLTIVAHEMGHIVNNDMRNQTFLDSFLYVTTMILTFPIKIILWPICVTIEEQLGIRNVSYVIHIVFGIIVDTVALWFAKLATLAYSRRREFRADMAAAKINGKEATIRTLRQLKEILDVIPKNKTEYATLAFSGNYSFADIFSTHPSLERRIKFIEKNMK